MSSKTKPSISESSNTRTSPNVARVRQITRSVINSPSSLQNSRLSIDRSPKSASPKTPADRRSPKVVTPPEIPRTPKVSEIQTKLSLAQEELKKLREQLSVLEKEKLQAVQELQDGNEKLGEAMAAQKRAEETTEIEKFRAVEMEQAGIETAQSKEREIESVKKLHASSLHSVNEELRNLKQEFAAVSEAKNEASRRALEASSMADARGEKIEMISTELTHLKTLLDSRIAMETSEKQRIEVDKNLEIESLRRELRESRDAEAEQKLVKKDKHLALLTSELERAKMAESCIQDKVEKLMRERETDIASLETQKTLTDSVREELESLKRERDIEILKLADEKDAMIIELQRMKEEGDEANRKARESREELLLLKTRHVSEIEILKSANRDHESDADRLKLTIRKLESKIDGLQSANDNQKSSFEDLRSTNRKYEMKIDGLRSTNANLESTNRKYEMKIDGLRSTSANLESTNRKFETRIEGLKSANVNLESEVEGLKAANANLESTNRKSETKIEGLRSMVGDLKSTNANLESMAESLRSTIDGLKSTNAEFELKIDSLKSTNAGLELMIDGLKSANAEFEAKIDGLKSTNAGFESKMDDLKSIGEREKSSMANEINELLSLLKSAEAEKTEVEEERAVLRVALVEKERMLARAVEGSGRKTVEETTEPSEPVDSEEYDVLPKVVEFSEENGHISGGGGGGGDDVDLKVWESYKSGGGGDDADFGGGKQPEERESLDRSDLYGSGNPNGKLTSEVKKKKQPFLMKLGSLVKKKGTANVKS